MLALVAVVLGVATGFLGGVGERALYATGLWVRGGASTLPPGALDLPATPASTTSDAGPSGLPSPVLPVASTAPPASAAAVAARVRAVDADAMGGDFSGQVADLRTGKVLYAHRAATPSIPASTTKLLTSVAALSLLGGDHVFSTRVVRGSGARVVLVGGGDPYLSRADLTRLAADAAAELRRTGTRKVAVAYDATLFSGPAWNPRWPATYSDQVTPVSALWVDEGRTGGGSPGPRTSTPARDAARVFAAALRTKGVAVTATTAGRAPAGATSVASVASLPLEQIVERLLLVSDNDAAEVLLRQAALAQDRPGSFVEGTRAVRRELTRLDLWDADGTLADGSGLARRTKVPAATMVALLRRAAGPDGAELRPVLTGLPVAGVEGSLRIRFGDDRSLAGRGVVRGKTGTSVEGARARGVPADRGRGPARVRLPGQRRVERLRRAGLARPRHRRAEPLRLLTAALTPSCQNSR